jgi:hypothetical protein
MEERMELRGLLPLVCLTVALVACESDAIQESQDVVGMTLKGRVLDDAGAPVVGVMLVLCGNVDGAEVCNQEHTQADGMFLYQDLLPGYTHLQVLPYAASADAGKLYAGVSLAVALPSAPAEVQWEDIVLPVIQHTQTLVVATGGVLELGPWQLEVAPGAAAFPDYQPSGPVGVASVARDHLPVQFAGLEAYAFTPYDTRLSQPARMTIPVTALSEAMAQDPDAVSIWVNATDEGGLYEVPATVADGLLTFTLLELTWVVLDMPSPGDL